MFSLGLLCMSRYVFTVTSGSNFLFLPNSYYHSGLKYVAVLFPTLHADSDVELSASKTLQQSIVQIIRF